MFTEKFKEKFWSRVDIKDDSECWNWLVSCNQKGYGQINDGTGKVHRAHRIAYKLTKGIIPNELLVLHSCDNRKCCNPNHLRLGTSKDNMDDKYQRSRENNLSGEKHQYFGKKRSIEICEKISNSRKGIIFSEETRQKMSVAKKGKTAHNKGKFQLDKSIILDIQNKLKTTVLSQYEIAKLFGLNQGTVSRINRGLIY